MSVGVIGGVIFYGRFYVQWIVSEMRGRSVMPVAFWYMSSAGSVMLLTFAVATQSPLGALGQNVNIIIYSRNLVHIWRERGALTPARNVALHGAVALIALIALGFVGWTWYREVEIVREAPAHEARAVWLWLAVGVVGQAMFAARFLIQWIVTEMERRSTVPTIFWYLSLAASGLQCAAFSQRGEWVFAIGMAATMLIYARNLWFIYTHPGALANANGVTTAG